MEPQRLDPQLVWNGIVRVWDKDELLRQFNEPVPPGFNMVLIDERLENMAAATEQRRDIDILYENLDSFVPPLQNVQVTFQSASGLRGRATSGNQRAGGRGTARGDDHVTMEPLVERP
jgi:hypothetical protein